MLGSLKKELEEDTMPESKEEPHDETVTDEEHQQGMPRNGGRLDGLARLGVGVLMLASGAILWRNLDILGILVASQKPGGVVVPFFSAAGTLMWLLAPYALMIGGVVVAARGAWRAIFGGLPEAKAKPPTSS
jgi:hypothetical protein